MGLTPGNTLLSSWLMSAGALRRPVGILTPPAGPLIQGRTMISEIKKSMRRAELLGKLDDGEIPDNPYPPLWDLPKPGELWCSQPSLFFRRGAIPGPENGFNLLNAFQAKAQRSQRKGRK